MGPYYICTYPRSIIPCSTLIAIVLEFILFT